MLAAVSGVQRKVNKVDAELPQVQSMLSSVAHLRILTFCGLRRYALLKNEESALTATLSI